MAANPESPFVNTAWLTESKTGSLVIAVHAQPGAKRTALTGLHADRLKIALNSPPVDGKANSALIKFLSKTLGIPKGSIELISGETSREKRIGISQSNRESLLAALKDAFPEL